MIKTFKPGDRVKYNHAFAYQPYYGDGIGVVKRVWGDGFYMCVRIHGYTVYASLASIGNSWALFEHFDLITETMSKEFKVGDFVVHATLGNGIVKIIFPTDKGYKDVCVYFLDNESQWFSNDPSLDPRGEWLPLSELSHATLPPATPTEPTDYEQAVALAKKHGHVSVSMLQRNIEGCSYKRGQELLRELDANGVVDITEAVYAVLKKDSQSNEEK